MKNVRTSWTEPDTDSGEKASTSVNAPTKATLDREAFAAHYQSNARIFWCIAASVLGHDTSVEDVLQEAAMIALTKLDQFETSTNFTAWMGQIVRFVALNHARKRSRSASVPMDPSVMEECAEKEPSVPIGPPITSQGEVLADQASFDDHVLEALNSLDTTARCCLLLRIVMGMSYREISLALTIPEGTAMSHVHRARRELREHMLNHRAPHDDPVNGND